MELLRPFIAKLLPPLTTTSCLNHNLHKKESSLKTTGRRRVGILALSSLVLRTQSEEAFAFEFEFGFVASDQQTIEDAEGGVRGHARDLLEVKGLLEAESWKEAQRELRMSSALLKKDIYTIIQNKPGAERPQLRKLYSTLFNNVTRLDYAARDKDLPQIWQRYKNIVVAVNDILSRI